MKLTFAEHIQKQERARFKEENGLEDARTKFYHCKANRKSWDEKAEFGAMVMANDLSFMDYLLSKGNSKNKVWGDNFIRTNISYSIANIKAADIRVRLMTDTAERSDEVQNLQAEINYAIDKFNMLRRDDQSLWFVKFLGQGYSYMGWNDLDQDSKWITGKPFKKPLDPRKVWMDDNTSEMDKSDRGYVFYKEEHNTADLKRQNPFLADIINENEANEDYRNTIQYRLGVTDVIRYQYKLTIPVIRRAIRNEVTKKTRFYLEEEYEAYLEKMVEATGLSVEMDVEDLKKIGEFPDETDVFPEAIRVSSPLKSEITAWFEVVYIEGIPDLIQEPLYLGEKSTIDVISGNYDPASAYSYGDAWRDKDLLEANILLMTIQLFDTIKKYKPIPVFMPGAFLNESDIVTKWGDPNFRLQLNPKFFDDNQHLRPKDCIWILDQPQVGQLQLALNDRLVKIAEGNQATPQVSKGVQEYAGMPAKGIIALQQAASQGNKNITTEYAEFMQSSYETLKVMIAEKRSYKHDIYAATKNGKRGAITIPENGLLDAAYDSYVRVTVAENVDIMKQIKEQKYMQLFQMQDSMGNPLIGSEDFLKVFVPDDAERLIMNNDKIAQQNMIMQLVETNPMVQQVLTQAMQEMQLGADQDPNSENKNATGNAA